MYTNSPSSGWRWLPGRKPWPPHAVEINRFSPLGQSLTSCFLYENPYTPSGLVDMAAPGRTFSFFGVNQQITQSPFGGYAFNTVTSDVSNYFFSSTQPPAPSKWTASSLIKFDGSIHAGGDAIVWITSSVNTFIGLSNDGRFTDNNYANFLTPAVSAWSTWTRITIAYDGTNTILYANGVLQSSAVLADAGFQLGGAIQTWPWPTADLFYWNMLLSPSDIAAHVADPYGTTMRCVGPVNPWGVYKPAFQPTYNNGPMMSA